MAVSQKIDEQLESIARRYEQCNIELEERENELRRHLDLMACSFPSIMMWNLLRSPDQEGISADTLCRNLIRSNPLGEDAATKTAPTCGIRGDVDKSQYVACPGKVNQLEQEFKRLFKERQDAESRWQSTELELRTKLQSLKTGVPETGQSVKGISASDDSIRSSDLDYLQNLYALVQGASEKKKMIARLERQEIEYMETLQKSEAVIASIIGAQKPATLQSAQGDDSRIPMSKAERLENLTLELPDTNNNMQANQEDQTEMITLTDEEINIILTQKDDEIACLKDLLNEYLDFKKENKRLRKEAALLKRIINKFAPVDENNEERRSDTATDDGEEDDDEEGPCVPEGEECSPSCSYNRECSPERPEVKPTAQSEDVGGNQESFGPPMASSTPLSDRSVTEPPETAGTPLPTPSATKDPTTTEVPPGKTDTMETDEKKKDEAPPEQPSSDAHWTSDLSCKILCWEEDPAVRDKREDPVKSVSSNLSCTVLCWDTEAFNEKNQK